MNPVSLKFGEFRLDLSPLRLWQNGREKKLPMKPLKLLAILAQRPGELVSQDDIRKGLWPDRTIDYSKSIHVHVRQIRKALDEDVDQPLYIITEPRQGYRFIAHVETVTRPRSWRTAISSHHPFMKMSLVALAGLSLAMAMFAINMTRPTGPLNMVPTSARDAYQRATYLLDAGDAWAALPILSEAATAAPGNASIMAGLARTHALMGDFESARPYAIAALEADPELASAHEAMAHILALADWRWADARNHLETAHRLDPDFVPSLHGLATLDALAGHWDRAHAHMQQARRLNPASTLLAADHAIFLFFARDYEAALTASQQAIQLGAPTVASHIYASRASLRLGDADTARVYVQMTMTAYGASNDQIEGLLAGSADDIRQAFHVWHLAQHDPDDAALVMNRAVNLAAMGEYDQALTLFETAIENRDPNAAILSLDPAFDPLRSDLRFQAAYAELGL